MVQCSEVMRLMTLDPRNWIRYMQKSKHDGLHTNYKVNSTNNLLA